MKRKTILIVAMVFPLWIRMGNPLSPGSSTFGHTAQSHPKLASGDYFFVESFPLPSSLKAFTNALTPIDFDHDGDQDVILMDLPVSPGPGPYGQGLFSALRNDGLGHFSDATRTVFKRDAASGVLQLLVADFNNDGRQDLFVPAWGSDKDPQLGEQNQIFIQTPQGRLANETNSRLPAIIDSTWGATAGDIDKDGDLDIFCCADAFSIGLGPYFLLNSGKGCFSLKIDNLPKELQPADGDWQGYIYNSSLLLDVDRDGDLDLAMGAWVGETGPAFRPRDTILLNDGKGYFTFAPDEHLPLRHGGKGYGTEQIISDDFNKDGWPDLIMQTDDYVVDHQRLQLLLNNGNGTFRDAIKNIPAIHTVGWTRIPTDINNDGWVDLLVHERSRTGIKILMNTGKAKFVELPDGVLPFPTDRSIDVSYPVDLDSDGDIDIFAVSNPPNGIGYVFRQLKPYVFSTKVLFPALLQAPANNGSGLPKNLTLRWTDQNKKPYPEETQYQVRVKAEGGTYRYFNVKKGRAYLRITGLAAGTTYSWNVKAVGNGKDIKDSEWAVSGNDWTFKTGA